MRIFTLVCCIILLLQHFASAATVFTSNPPIALTSYVITAALTLLLLIAVVIIISIALQRKKQRLVFVDALLSKSKDAVWVTDDEFNIIEVNRTFSEISGFSEDDVIGKRFKAHTSNGRDQQLEAIIKQELIDDGYWSGEIWNVRKNGKPYALDLSITKITTSRFFKKSVRYVGVFSDITARKNNERTMLKLTTKDTVTGLSNRAIFIESLEKAIKACNDTYPSLLIIFIDLDNFKKINDSLGHTVGDVLLKEVACRLTGALNSAFTIARLGADEFAILVPPYLYSGKTVFFAKKTADIVLQQFKTPFMLDGFETSLSACCGLAIYPDNAYNCENLMRSATSALNHAKKMGHNTYQFFDKDRHTLDPTELTKESALFRAINNNEFELYFQPQILASGELAGAEVLLRWQDPERGLVMPGQFIKVAEETGLILKLGNWVLEQACRQLASWQQSGFQLARLSVNVSPVQFQHKEFIDTLTTLIQRYEVDPTKLELELTEETLLNNVELVGEKMQKIRDLGVHLALDDFGTGYSSLRYLKHLPLSRLKIDRSFVMDLDNG